MNGNNGERGYTLERLRQEEGKFGEGYVEVHEDKSNKSSSYDVVDEMYENMNTFDQKIKTLKQQY